MGPDDSVTSNPMSAEPAMTSRFDADPQSAGNARRFVSAALAKLDREGVADEALVCTAELASNAILHTRAPFTLSVGSLPDGARIDVVDARPDRLPVRLVGEVDPIELGTTGRGLRMLSSVASRWGYFTTAIAKTVWVELVPGQPAAVSAPIVQLAARAPGRQDPTLRFERVPVDAAIASGRQVDDLVREVQLDPGLLAAGDRQRFLDLLDLTAPLRLEGRHMAFQAAAEELTNFTLEIAVSAQQLAAMRDLQQMLETSAPGSSLGISGIPAGVRAMRDWLEREAVAQLGGGAPTPFPG